jgi:hypothetical protein
MRNYEITFAWPNGNETWIYAEAIDFQQAMLVALDKCPLTCRVRSILFLTPEQLAANKASAARRADTTLRSIEVRSTKRAVKVRVTGESDA